MSSSGVSSSLRTVSIGRQTQSCAHRGGHGGVHLLAMGFDFGSMIFSFDENGNFPSLHLRSGDVDINVYICVKLDKTNHGISRGVIAGIAVGGVVGILLLTLAIYFGIYRRKKVDEVTLLPVPGASKDQCSQLQHEAAIKKMDMQASKEFLAELKVLTHVHHLNLV
ncbi:Syndecan/Neurexin domain [Sesbania bispinosa]|nr:Syndecan/Neurexin domain [Sesbania bispinosa]